MAQGSARTHGGRWLSQGTLSSPSQRERGLGCVHKLCHAWSQSQNTAPAPYPSAAEPVACGDRQQKGKLALIWHVDSCSSGTKAGPSAHCVWHEVGACIPNHAVLDSSLELHVEMPLPLRGLSWETGDFHNIPAQSILWAKKAPILTSWHLPHHSYIPWLTKADSCAAQVGLTQQGCLGTPGAEVSLNTAGLETGRRASKSFSGGNGARTIASTWLCS